MLHSLLSTIGISLATGTLMIAARHMLRLPRRLGVNLGLTCIGGGLLLLLHLFSIDLFGLDPWHGLGFDIAKHGLQLLVILMLLVAV